MFNTDCHSQKKNIYIYLKMIIVLEIEWLNRTSLNIIVPLYGTVEKYEMHVVFFRAPLV